MRNNLFFKAYIGGKDYGDSVDGKVDLNSKDGGIAKDNKDVDTHDGYNGSEVEYGKDIDIQVDNEEIEYWILEFEKAHTNNKRKKLNGDSAKDYKDVDTHGGNNGCEVDYEKNTNIWVDNDPNSPMPVARRAVDELIEFSGETEPSRYMNIFKFQQIFKGLCFLEHMHDEAQSSRSCLARLNAMISELEAMNDAGELFDSLMCLRDDKRVESEKLSLLNEMISMVEEILLPKKPMLVLVREGMGYLLFG
nr:hypothetical protein [Tanacetum cinerariifolium]